MRHTHCTLTYFKESGKYYSEGEFDVPHRPTGPDPGPGRRDLQQTEPLAFHECLREIRATLERGTRPGLVDGPANEFHVLVTVYTEFGPLRVVWSKENLT